MIEITCSDIISGIISGVIVTVVTIIISYIKKIPPKIKIADKISFYNDRYQIKFLNDINYPIAVISSNFIISYRKDFQTNHSENYRYKLTIPGESIAYISSKKEDEKKGQRNEKTYAALVINAQQMDQRTIENSNVSKNIQEIYIKYKKHENSINYNKESEQKEDNEQKNPSSLSLNDFFVEDDSVTIITIIEVKNLYNQITKTHCHTFSKDDIMNLPYCKGRSLELSETDD